MRPAKMHTNITRLSCDRKRPSCVLLTLWLVHSSFLTCPSQRSTWKKESPVFERGRSSQAFGAQGGAWGEEGRCRRTRRQNYMIWNMIKSLEEGSNSLNEVKSINQFLYVFVFNRTVREEKTTKPQRCTLKERLIRTEPAGKQMTTNQMSNQRAASSVWQNRAHQQSQTHPQVFGADFNVAFNN